MILSRFAAGMACAAAFHVMSANAAPPLDPIFDMTAFEPVDFTAHCQVLYGAQAQAVHPKNSPGTVECEVAGARQAAFPQSACEEQYAAGYSAVRTGLESSDWRCTNWQAADARVVPVILVASDLVADITEFEQAFINSMSLMTATQSWYAEHMPAGQSFRMTHPVVAIADFTAQELNDISCASYPLSERSAQCNSELPPTTVREFGLYFTATDQVDQKIFAGIDAALLVAAPIFVFTGLDATTIHLGAAAEPTTPTAQSGVWLNVQPPQFSTCVPGDLECGLWPLAHELGHSFGLAHSCDADAFPNVPNCWQSVMLNSNIDEMILLTEEQVLLSNSRFFEQDNAAGGASCTYSVESVWASGFQARIRIENTTDHAITGWQVEWAYSGASRAANSWEAQLSGANPYTASNLSWNANIPPGGAVEFRVSGTTMGGSSEQPAVTGAVCGD